MYVFREAGKYLNSSKTAGEWGPKAVAVKYANVDTGNRAALGYITSEVKRQD